MRDNLNKLKQWRHKRNVLKADTKEYISSILEELLEVYYTDKKEIEKMQNKIMLEYFQNRKEISAHNTLDTINDISVFSINEVENMGFNFDSTLNETIKEISCRKQNPNQKEIWEKWGASGKWKKDVKQDKNELYKGDYKICIK